MLAGLLRDVVFGLFRDVVFGLFRDVVFGLFLEVVLGLFLDVFADGLVLYVLLPRRASVLRAVVPLLTVLL